MPIAKPSGRKHNGGRKNNDTPAINNVAAGSDLQRLGLPAGIYVVNHQKILVK